MTKQELLERIKHDALMLSVIYRLNEDDGDLAGYWHDVAVDAQRCYRT